MSNNKYTVTQKTRSGKILASRGDNQRDNQQTATGTGEGEWGQPHLTLPPAFPAPPMPPVSSPASEVSIAPVPCTGRNVEREAVLSALAELALSRDPVTVAGIQRTVEMQRRSTIAAERVREILADCEADVVRKVVQALRTQGMRRPTPELVQRLAYALYQQDMALSRVRAYLEGGEAWPGEL